MKTVHLEIFKESYLDDKGPFKSIKIARLIAPTYFYHILKAKTRKDKFRVKSITNSAEQI